MLPMVTAMTLAACSPTKKEEGVQIPNPASAYCVEIGGKSVLEKASDGQEFGVCHLPGGEKIDEWELYRRDHPAEKSAK